jgi:methionyl-tRNA formyltransferase
MKKNPHNSKLKFFTQPIENKIRDLNPWLKTGLRNLGSSLFVNQVTIVHYSTSKKVTIGKIVQFLKKNFYLCCGLRFWRGWE